MKPLGFKARHQHAGCACCSPLMQKGYRRNGKRRDRAKAKRDIRSEIP